MFARISSTTLMLGALALAASATACNSPDQVVAGQLAVNSFPAPVTSVRVVQNGRTVVEQSVSADGRFSVSVPPGAGYRIEFAAAAGAPALVFPRRAGAVDSTFRVQRGGAPFDLGMVHYIGDPAGQTYSYGPGVDSGDTDDVECEDGIDPATGDVCVDDDDDEGASCEADDGDDDDVECEDGVDANTGLPCDDGDDDAADTDADDVECEDGVDANTGLPCDDDDDGELPDEAAIADHNLPSSVGCGEEDDDDDDDNVECEDGVDANTGLPCNEDGE